MPETPPEPAKDLWTTFLDFLSQIITPAWGDLIALLPFAFMGLVLLFLVMTAGFLWGIGQTIKAVELRRERFAIMDNVGGATLALIVGALAVAMTISVSVIILGAFNQSAVVNGDENLGALGDQIRGSELVPIFLKLQEPMLVAYKPWFPDGLPPILEVPPQPVT